LDRWDRDGTLERIHHALYVEVRERAGCEASPSLAIIDAQSAKGAQKGGATLDPSGYDAGKKVLGRKRHVLVDTLGLLLTVVVHPADVQDRDGAEAVLRQARCRFPFIERLIADAGYQGPKMAALALNWSVTASNSLLSRLRMTSCLRNRTKAGCSGVASWAEKPQNRRNDALSSSASASFTSDRSYQTAISIALTRATGGHAGSPVAAA
jgi:transposase